MAVRKNRALYQFRVSLRDIHPAVWRRFQVWEDTTLAELHPVLQIVMGWEDYHLHEFWIGGKKYGMPDLEYERELIDGKRTQIKHVVQRVGTEFEYMYDFGDAWHHNLLLDATLQPVPDTSYPHCIAGQRNCPPEDVGGPPGYRNYLAALADPNHEEHEDMLAWRGPFDPEAFSLSAINQQLQKKFHTARRQGPRATVAPSSAHFNPTKAGKPDVSPVLEALLSGSGLPRRDRIRIQPDEMVSLELNERERELILCHSLADGELTDRLRVVPKPGAPPLFRYTLDDLEELAGFVAAEANHAKSKKLRKELDQLCDRIAAALGGYAEE